MVQKRSGQRMIEIVTDKERNLKNLKQIGTPREENKIYIENLVYENIKESSYKEKRVFVLMGHTERMTGRYATFVEAAIPVREIEFSGNTPRWNNSTWSEVFHEIKRLYEDMIIVGWAVDIKGMAPKVTPELERVHREHFGGVHQLLFLLNTMEQEESFYVYKENKLTAKDGFYIYHHARKKERKEQIPVKVLPEKAKTEHRPKPEVDVELDVVKIEQRKGGKYRQIMQQQTVEKPTDSGNMGLAIAVAMLVFVVGVGVYENRADIFDGGTSIETNNIQEDSDNIPVDKIMDTETSADSVQELESEVETVAEDTEVISDVIPIEIIPDDES